MSVDVIITLDEHMQVGLKSLFVGVIVRVRAAGW